MLLPNASALAQQKERRVTVTIAREGDRFVDTMRYFKVKRATRHGQYGYEVTFDLGDRKVALFWSRDQIHFRGRWPRVREKSIPIPNGRLRSSRPDC